MTISLTPSNGMDVGGGQLTPVIIIIAPPIKVNQQPTVLHLMISDGGHTDHVWVLSVLDDQLHPCLDLRG